MIAAALSVPTCLLGTWIVAIQPLRAIMCSDWGVALEQNRCRELSIAAYGRAIELEAVPLLFRARLSQACLQAADEEADPDKRENYWRDAERSLLGARQINDLSRASMFLADLYLVWAANKPEPLKTVLNRKALTASREALVFEPHTPPVVSLNRFVEKLVNESEHNP
jgi:hypothetical protein